MTENETFSAFEGLAVKTAASVYAKWREALSRRGIGIEDAAQEGRAVLLGILPKLDDPKYVQAQRVSYVKRCVWGHVNNWAKAAARDGVDRRERPDPPETDRDGLLDLRARLAEFDTTTRAVVLAHTDGETFESIGKRYGISGRAVSRICDSAMATLRRKMHV